MTAFEIIRSHTLEEEVHAAVLKGGLRVYFCPKPGFQKKYACYSTYYGSVDNCFRAAGDQEVVTVPDGIAHFLEHTLFETEEGNVSDRFARNGAYCNAATSFNATTYLFASSDHFFENLGLLVDFVENPVFDPRKIDKEKGIVEQEILRYKDDPGWVGYMGLLEHLFKVHPLRIDIAGTPDSIGKIDSQSLHRCYRTFYHPRNMILFVVGDLNGEKVLDFIDRRSRYGTGVSESTVEPGQEWRVDRFYPDEPPEVPAARFQAEMEVALPKLLIGFKEVGVPSAGKELLLRELVTELALDLLLGRGSDVFLELYKAQLILDDFSASYHACAGVGCLVLGGETPHPQGLLERCEKLVAEVRDHGISAADFQRQKRKFTGGFIRAFNSLEFIASHYTLHRFHDLDLFEVIDVLHSLPQEAVEERIRSLFDPERQAVSLVLPKK